QGQVEHGLAHAALLDEAAAEEAAGREDHRVGLEARAALEQDRPGPSRRDVDPDDARGLALDGGGRPLQGRREPQALAAPGPPRTSPTRAPVAAPSAPATAPGSRSPR